MSKIDKIIRKLMVNSNNLTFEELTSLLIHYGYKIDNKGHTSGSRIAFFKKESPTIIMHKPHPRKVLLDYQIKQVKRILEQEHLL